MKKLTLFFSLSILFCSCFQLGYEKTDSGLEYKIFSKDGSSKKVKKIKKSVPPQKVQSENDQVTKACEGNGTEGCIDKVRAVFSNTGKSILGEEYLGDGVFGISFLDPSRGESFNAKVYTNCKCEIINTQVSVMR